MIYTLSGSAIEGSDFNISTSGLLVVSSGTTSVNIPVDIVDDSVNESSETIVLTLSAGEFANYTLGSQTSHTLTISDDDMVTLALSADPSLIEEAGGEATVTVTAAGGTFATDRTVDLSFGGTATEGTDYAVSSSQLTLRAGEDSVTATVTAMTDDVAEGDETIVIRGTVISSGSDDGAVLGPATVTIEDDDMVTLALSADPSLIEEAGGEATVAVTAAGGTFATDRTVDLSFGGTATEGTDYAVSSSQLTLRAGEDSVTATVTAMTDDVAEGDETIVIRGTVISSGSDDGAVLGPATVTIEDDDMVTLALSADPSLIEEAGGEATVTVTAAGGTFATDRTVDLSFGGTATEGTDYAVSSSQLTLRAGEDSVTATVTAMTDDVAEGDETIVIRGTVISSGSDDGAVLGPATVTIEDDDMVTLALSADPSLIEEAGGEATVAVTAAGGTFATDRTVDLSFGGTATEGTDYAVSSSQLTLRAGEDSVTATVTAMTDDVAEGDETIVIRGTVISSGSDDGAVLGPATVTIEDDDMVTLALSADPSLIEEAGGEATVAVTAAGGTFATDRTVDLSFGGTATEGTDYAVSSSQLTLRAGEDSVTATVTAMTDDVAEGDETVLVRGTTAVPGLTVESTTITITDDDEEGVELSATSLSVTEQDASGSYTVRLQSAPLDTVTVTPSSDNPEAVTVSPSQLTFTANNWDQAQAVTVTAGPEADAGIVTAMIRHAVSGYGNVTAAAPVSVTMVVGPTQVEVQAVAETLQAVTAGSLSNVTTNIGARFSAARSGGAALTLAGQPVVSGTVPDATRAWGQHLESPSDPLAVGNTARLRGVGFDELLQTSAFELSLNAAEDGSGGLGLSHWTLWGRGDILVFDNDPSTGARYDGDLKAGYLGLDAWVNGRWLIGVAASRTQVNADYSVDDGSGRLDVTLTGVHPYVRFAPDTRRELWAILGAGTGEVENARSGTSERESTDVEMYMAAAGVRQALEPLANGVAVALLGDAGFGRLNGDAGSGLGTIDNLAVDTWRARAGAEISYTMPQDSGTSITPFAEIAGRVDGGGEDETKAGVEVSAGVAYADPASGFGLEARGRTLVLYSGGDYREYGASLTASLSPGSGGEGLSLALSPRLGVNPGTTGVLWREDPFRALNTDRSETALSLDAEVGYGFAVPSVRGVLTPFGEFRVWNGNSRHARAGVRFGAAPSVHGLHLEFAGARQEDSVTAPDHRVELIGRMRF